MRTKITILLFLAFAAMIPGAMASSPQSGNDPWTQQQLMAPADLAKVLNNPKSPQPLIFSVGMQAVVKNSIEIGPAMIKDNLNLLKQKLDKLAKNTEIVVYCGCCPFSRCPNVRPAIELLKSMQFTNFKLLNLPQNIKVDWIDKGYPVSE